MWGGEDFAMKRERERERERERGGWTKLQEASKIKKMHKTGPCFVCAVQTHTHTYIPRRCQSLRNLPHS